MQFQDRLGQALRANSTFELCAGKKVGVSAKRRYKMHSSSQGKLHFSPMMTRKQMSNNKWIIGGQDSCHVCLEKKLGNTLAFFNLFVKMQRYLVTL